LVVLLALFLLPPICMFRSLKRKLNALAPIVEKLEVRLLLAACMAVMIRINANIPNAMITTVIAVRNLLPMILRQERESVSVKVIEKYSS